MRSLQYLRVLTSLGVMAACAFAFLRGIDLTRFALAELPDDSRTLDERLRPFVDSPGVAPFARRQLLRGAPSLDAETNIEAASNLLARAPLDSEAWATLASLRFKSGAPVEQGAQALALSNLTGPNEGWVMAKRAFLALPLWRVLPPESRRAAISDLVTGWPHVSDLQRAALGNLLSSSSAREEVRAALLLAGAEAAPVVRKLGLGAPAGESVKP